MDWLNQRLEQYRPVARAAADTSRAYADRIIALLEGIEDAVVRDEFIETRRFTQLTVPSGGATVPLGDLSSDSEWVVEAVTTGAAATLSVAIDGQVRWYGVAAGPATLAGNGVLLQGPGSATIAAPVGGPALVLVQLRMKSIKPRRKATGAGVGDPAANLGTGLGEPSVGRHTGTWYPTKIDPPVPT